MQNLLYALIQSLHNINAAAIAGIAAAALWQPGLRSALARWAAGAWALQGLSGLFFGITTYAYERHLPDIHGIAVLALGIKVLCVLSGLALAFYHMKANLNERGQVLVWRILLAWGLIALTSAAFLRWDA